MSLSHGPDRGIGTRPPPPPFLRDRSRKIQELRRNQTQRQPRGGRPTRVAVLIHYSDGSSNTGRYVWPNTITEQQALRTVLTEMAQKEPSDLDDLERVTFTQVAQGSARLAWLDAAPMGLYLFNQEYADDDPEPLDDPQADYDPDYY